ncbi:MAG: hypothetical protein JEY79_07205 [Pseudodesulfovibrio sp.]|nr:hypothetical protein [Pseudodesulfovibrio sp.]
MDQTKGAVVIFCSSLQLERLENELAKHFDGGVSHGVWVKHNPDPKKSGPTNAKENFVVAWRKGCTKLQKKKTPWNVLSSPICMGNELLKQWCAAKGKMVSVHRTQKPIEVLARILKRFIPEDAHVFDPCAGTGAIGRACVITGRNCTGIELDPHFFEKGAEAFQDADYMQLCAERAKRADTTHGEVMLNDTEKILKKAGIPADLLGTIRTKMEKLSGYKLLSNAGKIELTSLWWLLAMGIAVATLVGLLLSNQ